LSIKITKAGIADSIQDAGRYGWQHLGINPTGAMDNIAMQIVNALVGNDLNDAVIELHFPASTFLFEEDVLIALSGADFSATINQHNININTAILVPKNSELKFTSCHKGARCYMAVYGGFMIQQWLESSSTNLKAKAGGMDGSFLAKGDCIAFKSKSHFKQSSNMVKALPWQADAGCLYSNGNTIRAIEGNEFSLLKEESQDVLEESIFNITQQNDRMGYRLNGIPLQLLQQKEMISSAVTKGTVQLLPDGHLIVLMADHQTTGGYPKLAHIVAADIPKLAQMKTNEHFQFQFISLEDAEKLFIKQCQHLHQLQIACNLKLEEYFANDQH
jgi:antagonist of KipI